MTNRAPKVDPDEDGEVEVNTLTKDNPVVNVTHPDYGATGDGSTDDLSAFNSATTAADPNGTVYVPPASSDYFLNGNLALTNVSGVTIKGSGQTNIQFADGNGIVIDGGSENRIEGFLINTDTQDGTSTSTLLDLKGGTSANLITDVRFNHGSLGIQMNNTSQNEIVSCFFGNLDRAILHDDTRGTSTNNDVHDNVFGTHDGGSTIVKLTDGDRCSVYDNLFETTVDTYSIENVASNEAAIQGNKIFDSGGIYANSPCVISGNVIKNAATHTTPVIHGDASFDGGLIANNRATEASEQASTVGIRTDGQSVAIEGNVVQTFPTGIEIDASFVEALGNIMSDTDTAFSVISGSDSRIAENTYDGAVSTPVSDSGTRTVRNGKYVTPPTLSLGGTDGELTPTDTGLAHYHFKADAGGSNSDLQGINGTKDIGTRLTLIHTGGETINVVDDSASASTGAALKHQSGANVTLDANDEMIQYEYSGSEWREVYSNTQA